MNYKKKEDKIKEKWIKMKKAMMTKRAWKELQKKNRATNGFNTGTREMKSEKYPTRAKQKELDRKEMM